MMITCRWTKLLRRPLAIALLALGGTSCGDAMAPEDEYHQALLGVEGWAASHATSWNVVTGGPRAPRLSEGSPWCAWLGAKSVVALDVQTASARVKLYFSCPVSAPATVQALRDAFSFAVLEDLPHGIAVPNWRFEVLTPTSSFSSGVSFLDAGAGRVRIHIETTLVGIRGSSSRSACMVLDAPAPPLCHIYREHRIPLTLDVVVPFDGTVFYNPSH